MRRLRVEAIRRFPEHDGLPAAALDGLRRELVARSREHGRAMRDLGERIADVDRRVAELRCADDRVGVTDHAVLRYLERVRGLDVEALRSEIADAARAASPVDDPSNTVVAAPEGLTFAFVDRRSVTSLWRTGPADAVAPAPSAPESAG